MKLILRAAQFHFAFLKFNFFLNLTLTLSFHKLSSVWAVEDINVAYN